MSRWTILKKRRCEAIRVSTWERNTANDPRPEQSTFRCCVIKHVDCKTFLVIVSQGVQQKQKQSMMYSKFRNMAAHTIGVQDGADHVYDLPHSVAEPSFYVAVDLGVKMLQTLLTGSRSREAFSSWVGSTARCDHRCAPEVKAGQTRRAAGASQSRAGNALRSAPSIHQPISTAKLPPASPPPPNSRVR